MNINKFQYFFIALVGVIIFLLLPVSAEAQQISNNCAPYERVVTILMERYNEQLVGGGVDGNYDGLSFEIWADPIDGSWTILSIVEGLACMAAGGSDYTPAIFGAGV